MAKQEQELSLIIAAAGNRHRKMWLLLVGFIVTSLAIAAASFFLAKPLVVSQNGNYYDTLAKNCPGKVSSSGCLESVEIMRKYGYKQADNSQCPAGFKLNTILSIGALQWCEPENNFSDWKTYRNEVYGYEVQYPPNWIEPSREDGDTSFAVGYAANEQITYWITSSYISQSQLNVLGVNYCATNMDKTARCEQRKVGGVNAQIDWGIEVQLSKIEKQSRAVALIPHSNQGIVVFDLQPVSVQSRQTFDKILSTFKFIEQGKNKGFVKACPEYWYVDGMPGPPDDTRQREYLIYQGVRRELLEFDMDWVKANCNISQEYVY